MPFFEPALGFWRMHVHIIFEA